LKSHKKNKMREILNNIVYFNSCEFTLDELVRNKKDKKIFIVFSTFGERESDLVFSKINLLKTAGGDFIDKIFLSHRRVDCNRVEKTEVRARDADPGIEIVICNSLSVPDMGEEKGKGADMRRTIFYINSICKDSVHADNVIIVFLDADVLPEFFNIHFVLGLAGAVLEGFDFAKASFWREMGRVKKFVAQPLFSIIDHPNIKNLSNFAYPLSGEVGGTLSFFNSVDFWQIYGVETGMIFDACFGNYKVADVNLGKYDHQHHPDANIQRMSFGIIRTFFLKLLEYGVIELKDGATIGDILSYSFIDDNGKRNVDDFDLTERKYQPCNNII